MVAAQGPYKILVVDDEPDIEPLLLQRMRRKIRSGRYQFLFAHNGVDALEKLNKYEGIDMVPLGYQHAPDGRPHATGADTQGRSDIRAVIISAYGDMKNIRTAMNGGRSTS